MSKLWTYWWYGCAAFAMWDFSVDHEPHRLALSVIYIVIGTGQRIVVAIEKGQQK